MTRAVDLPDDEDPRACTRRDYHRWGARGCGGRGHRSAPDRPGTPGACPRERGRIVAVLGLIRYLKLAEVARLLRGGRPGRV